MRREAVFTLPAGHRVRCQRRSSAQAASGQLVLSRDHPVRRHDRVALPDAGPRCQVETATVSVRLHDLTRAGKKVTRAVACRRRRSSPRRGDHDGLCARRPCVISAIPRASLAFCLREDVGRAYRPGVL